MITALIVLGVIAFCDLLVVATLFLNEKRSW
jgi:hypothetical protein